MASYDCPEYKKLEEVLKAYRDEANVYRHKPPHGMGQRKARQLALAATEKGNKALEALTLHHRNCPICKDDQRTRGH